MPTVSYVYGNVFSEIVANTTTTGTQRAPVVAVDETTKNIFLGFTSDRAGGGDELRGRMFNREGTPLSTDFLIAGGPNGTFQVAPAITSLADTFSTDGGFLVAYQDDTDDATDGTNIEWARYSNVGAFEDADEAPEVNVGPALDNQKQATVTGLTGGNYVVAFKDEVNGSGTNTNITHAVYLADGTLINSGAHYSAGTLTSETLGQPSVAALQTGGGFVMVWQEDLQAGAGFEWSIRAQRFDSVGNPVGGVINITTESDNQFQPQVVGLPGGGFAVIYGDQQAGSTVDQRLELNIYDNNGGLIVDAAMVSAEAGNELFYGASISVISNNYLLVIYSKNEGGASDYDVFAKAFDFSGNQIGEEFDLEVTSGEQLTPSVAGMGNGQFVTAWTDTASTIQDFSGSHIALQANELQRHITGDDTDEILIGQDDLRDVIWGMGGNDLIIGGEGNDVMHGGDGDDILSYGSGFQYLDGNNGNDTAFFGFFGSAVWVNLAANPIYNGQSARAWTRDSSDLSSGEWRGIANLQSIENVVGTLFDDTIIGDENDNVIGYGGLIGGNGGFDTYDGGGGSDTAAFGTAGSAIWVNLNNPGANVYTQDDVDLEGGVWRSVAALTNIENIVATNFSDELRGNGADNKFTFVGNNPLEGGLDFFNGHGGSDTASFSQASFAVWADLEYAGVEAWTKDTNEATAGVGPWREIVNLSNIENLEGSDFSDVFIGDEQNNIFTYYASGPGGGGLDSYDGGGGEDFVNFADVDFAVWVGLNYNGVEAWTQDTDDAAPGVGNWREIVDLNSIESIGASNFSDHLNGDDQANQFFYQSSHQFGGGLDVYDGLGGSDTADFDGTNAAVWVDLEYNGVEAWTKDTENLVDGSWREIAQLSNIENLTGSEFGDLLRGDTAANTITGGRGDDTMAAGIDTETDTFAFRSTYGDDTVHDFDANNEDIIQFESIAGLQSFADLTISATNGGADTLIETIGGNSIYLVSVTTAEIGSDDFAFV